MASTARKKRNNNTTTRTANSKQQRQQTTAGMERRTRANAKFIVAQCRIYHHFMLLNRVVGVRFPMPYFRFVSKNVSLFTFLFACDSVRQTHAYCFSSAHTHAHRVTDTHVLKYFSASFYALWRHRIFRLFSY